jgi:hypothetical protein
MFLLRISDKNCYQDSVKKTVQKLLKMASSFGETIFPYKFADQEDRIAIVTKASTLMTPENANFLITVVKMGSPEEAIVLQKINELVSQAKE